MKQIEFDDYSINLIFFNSFKTQIKLSLKDIDVQIYNDKIRIIKKDTGKLIGVIYKEFLINHTALLELSSFSDLVKRG